MRTVEQGTWVAIVPTLSEIIRGATRTRIYLCEVSTFLEALLDENIAKGLAGVKHFNSMGEAINHPYYGTKRGLAIELTAVGEITYNGVEIMNQQLANFIAKVYELTGFDEEGSAAELLKLSERFEKLRKAWVGGEAYDESQELEKIVNAFYRDYAKVHSSDLCLSVERAFSRLSEFCLMKHRAINNRLLGKIEPAKHFEAAAEREYNQLPEQWRW